MVGPTHLLDYTCQSYCFKEEAGMLSILFHSNRPFLSRNSSRLVAAQRNANLMPTSKEDRFDRDNRSKREAGIHSGGHHV